MLLNNKVFMGSYFEHVVAPPTGTLVVKKYLLLKQLFCVSDYLSYICNHWTVLLD